MTTTSMTGRNPVMKVMWNREKVARSVQETLRRMMIAAVTWTLLTIVSNGKDKTKWGTVKVPHIFIADGKIF
jgi:hypothetical protein